MGVFDSKVDPMSRGTATIRAKFRIESKYFNKIKQLGPVWVFEQKVPVSHIMLI